MLIGPYKEYRKHVYLQSHLCYKLLQNFQFAWHPCQGKNIGKKQSANLKDSFSLSGMVNQSINQLHKNLVKPSQVEKFAKLGEKTEESFSWISGQSILESIDALQKESKLRFLLKHKITQERKYPEHSPNFNSSLKDQKKSSIETITKNY